MAEYLNTNMASLIAQNNLSNTQSSLTTAIQRLSSGLRINSAADDAAGYAIAQNMTTQINGSNQASLNANNGVSLAQTGQGDLSTILTNLQSAYSLAVESANATNSTANRQALNDQVQQLLQENQRIAQSSNFNGVNLLDGSFTGQTFQVGANSGSSNQITIGSISSMQLDALGGVGTTMSTTVTGTAVTTALSAGDLTLNGYQVGASVTGGAPGQDANSAYSIAQAINAISAQSGVTATANATTSGDTAVSGASVSNVTINGVNLGTIAGSTSTSGEAANIVAAINAVSSQTGVTATPVGPSGYFALNAADGRNIVVSGTTSGAISAAATIGLASGTAYSFLNLNSSTALAGASGTAVSGVSGSGITINGVAIGTISSSASASGEAANIVAAINAVSSQTGVTAATVGTTGGYTLSSNGTSSGAIVVSGTSTAATGAATSMGLTSGTFATAYGITIGGNAPGSAGLTAGSTAITTTTDGLSLANTNVLSVAAAQSAMIAIQGAINTVTSNAAALGAYQNRFTAVVNGIQTDSQNLSQSLSRIQDTNYAQETAILSQQNVLSQAGTAMLAQANTLPNQILTLLR